MGLLIGECLPDETAIDRASLWAEDQDGFAAAPLLDREPPDDDDQLGNWGSEPWERPSLSWLEVRLGLLRAVFSEE